MVDLELRINATDKIIAQYGARLASLSNGLARVVMARALNHEGDKARTQIKRVLVKQTGINYNQIEKSVQSHKAFAGKLSYIVEANGHETNLGQFQARETNAGINAAPWNDRQVFRGTFFTPGTRKVVRRNGSKYTNKNGELKDSMTPLFGPNLARELVRDESKQAWIISVNSLASRIGHELARALR